MRTRRRLFLEQASPEQLRIELTMASREHAFTKAVFAREHQQLQQQREDLALQREELALQEEAHQTDWIELERERDHWKRQAQVLQLQALRLQDSVQRQQGV